MAAFGQELSPKPRDAHGTQPFHASIAGTCMNKDDFSFTAAPVFNGTTGAFRLQCDLAGDSTHGHVSSRALAEEAFTVTACTQPGGASGVQFPIKGFAMVVTFNAGMDQLILTTSTGGECGSFTTGIGIGQATFRVLGGTGRFAGATGSVTIGWTDIAAALSALGGDGIFAAYSATLDGFITLK